jgi:hypothetical protein
MKTKIFRITIQCLLLFSVILGMISCEKIGGELPPYIEEPEDSIGTQKQFEIYEWLGYPDKPDLLSEKVSKIFLIGESQITKPDPTGVRPKGVLDWDKIALITQQAKLSGYKFINTDIETWWGNLDANTYASDHDEMFKYIKKEIPGAILGAYGIPVSNLKIRRWKREHLPEQEIIDEWKRSSESRFQAGYISDVLAPSFYIDNPDTTQWLKDLKTTVEYLKEKFPYKKIYGYLWPQYYDLADNPYYKSFIEPEVWNALLEGAYKYLDGVILWAGSTDSEGNTVSWNDPRVQTFWNVTKDFIAKYSNTIKVVAPEYEGDEIKEPEVFHMYQSITFDGTPSDLTSYGLKPIRLVSAADLSADQPDLATGIKSPDVAKIEALALDVLNKPNIPVVINSIDNWITDRTSNNAAMIDRFKLISETFKAKNSTNKLGFQGVGPTSMTTLRLNEGRTEYQITDSWFRYAAQPMRALRQYADVLIPAPSLIDDNLTQWKGDCVRIIIEAKQNNPSKPIFAYLWTNYFNRNTSYPFFADAYKPIKEQTWMEVLEFIYQRCDGVIIVSNAQKNDPVTWSEDLGLIKATKTFYQKHKAVIDRSMQ